MPEVSKDAAVLIATSYQAMKRAEAKRYESTYCDCLAALIFTCFYVEETLDVVIAKLGGTEIIGKRKGMFAKFRWFYENIIPDGNTLLAKVESEFPPNSDEKYEKLKELIDNEFPGYKRINEIRDQISHANLDYIPKDLNIVKKIRQDAKDIVSLILEKSKSQDIRSISYWDAISTIYKDYSGE